MSIGGSSGNRGNLPLSNADVTALSSVVAAAVSRTLALEERRGNSCTSNERRVTRSYGTPFVTKLEVAYGHHVSLHGHHVRII